MERSPRSGIPWFKTPFCNLERERQAAVGASVDRSASPHRSYTWEHLAQCMADFPTVDAEMLMAAAEV